MNRGITHICRLLGSMLFFWIYIPHLLILLSSMGEALGGAVLSDVTARTGIHNKWLKPFFLVYLLHSNAFFRTLYYHRIGEKKSLLIRWIRPGAKYFKIYPDTKIGANFGFWHPFATIINANFIGDNFRCMQCTTLGAKGDLGELKPTIGNNVTLGANVTIVGDVRIGDNVIVGAGSVVTKDIPDNCIVVGVPAKVIKEINPSIK